MSVKRWLCLLAGAFALAAAAWCALNVLTDPFGVFGDPLLDWYGYNITSSPGTAKVGWLQHHGQDYDSYVLGSSGAAVCDVEQLNAYLDARFYNLAIPGSGAQDCRDLAAWLLEKGGVKHLVLCLGLEEAAGEEEPPAGGMHAAVRGENPLPFYLGCAFSSPRYALDKLSARRQDGELPQPFDCFDPRTGCRDTRLLDIEKIGDPEVYAASCGEEFSAAPGQAGLPRAQACVQAAAQLRDLCRQHGVQLTVILTPAYAGQWSRYSEQAIRAYLTALAREVDFWDFTLTSISWDSRYFYDSHHFRSPVGAMVLAEVFGDETLWRPEGFGSYVTAETCADHLEDLFSDPPAPDTAGRTIDVPVLLYHHVVEQTEGEPSDTVVTLETLDWQLRLLVQEGYHAVTAQELIDYVYHGGELPDKPVFITFDDGYYSNYALACPLLERYGLKATVFAIGVSIGHMAYYKDTEYPITPHFGYDEAREMQQSGVMDLQSHTYDMHQWPPFETGGAIRSTILPLEGESFPDYAAALQADLETYEQERTAQLGEGFCALAYPEGRYCDWTEVLLHQAGIPLTLSTRSDSRNVLVRGLPQSLYALCRWYMTEQTTPEQLLSILQGT